MEKCGGLHCSGCGGHGGGPGLAVALLIVVVIAAGSAAAHAVLPTIETALEITGYTLASLAGLAVLGGVAYGGYRVHRAVVARRAAAAPRVISVRVESSHPAPPDGLGEVTHGSINADLPALEAPRIRPVSWPLSGQWDEIQPGGGDRRAN